jgi:hypothetical protein
VQQETESLHSEFSEQFPGMDMPDEMRAMIDETAELISRAETEYHKLEVMDWIKSIENQEKPDGLTKFDQYMDGQIGGWGDKLEYVMDTERAVPIWEFRDLGLFKTGRVLPKLQRVEREIIKLHRQYAIKPTL